MKKTLLISSVLAFCFFSSLSFAQLATHVVIAEVYGGGGNASAPYTNDYVVLYNPTLSAVDVSTWSVQYEPATTSTAYDVINLIGSIPAQSYYLVQFGSSGSAVSPVPFQPDVSNSRTIAATAGKIALVNNQTALPSDPTLPDANIIDFVGYGTTATVFEGSRAPAPSNTTSVRRKDNSGTASAYNYGSNGSGWDTNDNSADFYVQSTLLLIPNYPISLNSVANHVVIAEVYGGGGLSGASYTNDYVVLYNSSASDVDLSTRSLQYTSATGTVWATINLTGTIIAKKYYLIQLGSGGANGVALPTPNFTDATDIDLSNGKIALVRNQVAVSGANPVTSDADIVDMVGYGTADGYEGTIGPSSSPGNTSSIRRKDKNNANTNGILNGSGYDANNNSSDFYIETDIITNPPAPTTISTDHVVIAEVYTGGGNAVSSSYKYDYVVLYNPTGSDITLDGTYSLQRRNPAGSPNTWYKLNLTGIISSLGYYIIQGSIGANGGGADLPITPNLIDASFNLSTTQTMIALLNVQTILGVDNPTLPDANIKDFVGYGTSAPVYEGSGPVAVLSLPNTQSFRRKDNIGNNTYGTNGSSWDTNNNNSDFYVQSSPVPLPVELSSFSVSVIGSNVKLNWKTETEVNNYGFEVERYALSAERQAWEKIGFVNGNGNSNSPKDYSFVDDNVSNGTYSYRLKQIDNDGQFEYSKTIEVVLGTPRKFELSQNYPNPFNPATTIKFTLPEAGNVKLTLFNILGQEVKTLVNGFKESGVHTVDFNASELNSGIYIYKIEAGSFVQTRKMTLLK